MMLSPAGQEMRWKGADFEILWQLRRHCAAAQFTDSALFARQPCYAIPPREAAMVSIDHFRKELLAQMGRAAKGGLIDVLITSGELYRSLGGYPGSTGCRLAVTPCGQK
jgi:hypothetical protein